MGKSRINSEQGSAPNKRGVEPENKQSDKINLPDGRYSMDEVNIPQEYKSELEWVLRTEERISSMEWDLQEDAEYHSDDEYEQDSYYEERWNNEIRPVYEEYIQRRGNLYEKMSKDLGVNVYSYDTFHGRADGVVLRDNKSKAWVYDTLFSPKPSHEIFINDEERTSSKLVRGRYSTKINGSEYYYLEENTVPETFLFPSISDDEFSVNIQNNVPVNHKPVSSSEMLAKYVE